MPKMKAVRFYGQNDIRYEDIDEPTSVKKGWVKVAPAFCGICGTDLHEYLGGNNLIPAPGCPHAITGETSPLTIGHEFSGVVEEVGEGITDLKVGQKVCVQPTIYCGECHACQRKLPNCCERNGFQGLSGWGGGLAEHVVAPRAAVWPLPPNVTLELGALIEPLAVGYHAVEIAPIPHPIAPGTPILILGGGPIGLSVIQAILAQSSDLSKPPLIIVSEPSSARQKFALQFGAHHAINPLTTDLLSEVHRLTSKEGVHVVFDAAGVQAGLDSALKCVRPRGTIVNIAVWEKRATLNMNDLVFRERNYMGIATYSNDDFGKVLQAIDEGRMNPGRMITRTIGLDRVEEDGFRALIEDKDNQVKILVVVGGEEAGKK